MTNPEFVEENPAGEQPAGAPASSDESVMNNAAAPEAQDTVAVDAVVSGSPAESAEELVDPLTEAMNTIASLEDQLARRNADLYNLEQQYNGFVRRSRAEGTVRQEEGIAKVIDTLLPVLDDIALARQHDELSGPFAAIVDKLESTLKGSFKLERFGEAGDPFDPMIHEALMNSTSADVTEEQVSILIQPGYKLGDKVIRPARVGVVSPE